MVAAVLVIVAIAVGLPLFAWWIGGRRFWGRLRPAPVRFLPSELRARHRLTVLELTEVRRAATQGRELTDPRLRAATAEYAGAALTRLQRLRRLPEILMVTGTVMAVALVVALLTTRDPVHWSPFVTLILCLNLIGQGLVQRRLRTRYQRAVELNTGQDAVSRQNGSGGHVLPGRADS